MSFSPHSSSSGGGKRPPWDRKTLGLSKGGAEKSSAKRTRTQRSERAVRALRNHESHGLSSSSTDVVAWIKAVYQEATGTLPAGARVPPAPPSILDPEPEPTPIASASEPLPLTSSGAGASSSSDVAPFPCLYCHRAYASPDTLARHVRTHHDHGDVRYCPDCRFASDRDGFHEHRLSHRRAFLRPLPRAPGSSGADLSETNACRLGGLTATRDSWRCQYCPRVYLSPEHLSDHVRRYHDSQGRRYCYECSFITADMEAFRAHRSEHNRRRLCRHCRTRIPVFEFENHVRTCSRRE
ncbi:hypothetical protein FGB62_272g01 [Gracilaria domingensis]|nr:hypothetical protein FGB62_272g01 [Gracilaria domingensis]